MSCWMLAALAVGRSLLKRYLPLQQTESSSNVKRQRIMVTENGSGDCQSKLMLDYSEKEVIFFEKI